MENLSIVGNKDASKEVILNGELGVSIDPDNVREIAEALKETVNRNLNDELLDPSLLQRKALDAFGYEKYKKRLNNYIQSMELI